MKLGFKKNNATEGLAVALFEQCERLYNANQALASEDQEGCADYLLKLASPRGGTDYVLVVHNDPERHYGLFPAGKWAGHGSFIEPGGRQFLQHGRITETDAVHIIATFTPVAYR